MRLIYVGLLLLVPVFVKAQSLAEHAGAMAGGGLGVLGGKPVSAGVQKALEKTGDSVRPPASRPASVKTINRRRAASNPGIDGPPSGAARGENGRGEVRPTGGVHHPFMAAEAGSEVAQVVPSVTEPLSIQPSFTASDFARIQPGAARSDILRDFGKPSSHITIPDDGHLVEIFRYSVAGHWAGTLRLDNGLVVKVDTAK